MPSVVCSCSRAVADCIIVAATTLEEASTVLESEDGCCAWGQLRDDLSSLQLLLHNMQRACSSRSVLVEDGPFVEDLPLGEDR